MKQTRRPEWVGIRQAAAAPMPTDRVRPRLCKNVCRGWPMEKATCQNALYRPRGTSGRVKRHSKSGYATLRLGDVALATQVYQRPWRASVKFAARLVSCDEEWHLIEEDCLVLASVALTERNNKDSKDPFENTAPICVRRIPVQLDPLATLVPTICNVDRTHHQRWVFERRRPTGNPIWSGDRNLDR